MEFAWKDEVPEASRPPGNIVISSFPSAGLATTVAGHYIIRTLKIPRVARFESPDLSPVAVVQSSVVHPAIRVYGRPDLSLVLSEFPPTIAQANAVAETILSAAERRRARCIIGLEGVVPHPADEEDEEEEKTVAEPPGQEHVWLALSRKDSPLAAAFAQTKAKPLEEGLIGGVSGALLVRGIGRSVPVAVLLVSARNEGLPDHRAGAALIETLDQLLPELKIDTGPLREQAEQIERMLRAAMKSRPVTAEGEEGQPPEATGMYR
jgi:predicted ATP-grasp superfamily ATP-dependent carboligase